MDRQEAQSKYAKTSLAALDHSKIKVEVGQVWGLRDGDNVTITDVRISGPHQRLGCYVRNCHFASLSTDGTPTTWASCAFDASGWRMIGWEDGRAWPVAAKAPAAPIQQSKSFESLTAFFAKVQDGQCPCGMLKSSCDYHR